MTNQCYYRLNSISYTNVQASEPELHPWNIHPVTSSYISKEEGENWEFFSSCRDIRINGYKRIYHDSRSKN